MGSHFEPLGERQLEVDNNFEWKGCGCTVALIMLAPAALDLHLAGGSAITV